MIKEPNVTLEDNQFYLPIGLEVDGQFLRKVTLKPMTGAVEEAITDSKIQNNGGKIETELLFGVVDSIEGLPRVTKDHIREMTIADRDYLMAKNYIVSFGNELQFKQKCPTQNCGTENTLHIDVPSMETTYLDDTDPRTLSVEIPNGVKQGDTMYNRVTLRFPSGADQEAIAPMGRTNVGQANTTLLFRITSSIKDVQGVDLRPLNPLTFKNMTKKDRDHLNRVLKEATAGVDFNVTYTCVGCGSEHTTRIPATSFLSE